MINNAPSIAVHQIVNGVYKSLFHMPPFVIPPAVAISIQAILHLETYKIALDTYTCSSWNHEWRHMKQQFIAAIDDLVDCDAWSIVDHFLFLANYF